MFADDRPVRPRGQMHQAGLPMAILVTAQHPRLAPRCPCSYRYRRIVTPRPPYRGYARAAPEGIPLPLRSGMTAQNKRPARGRL
jgi:hypothetical protein